MTKQTDTLEALDNATASQMKRANAAVEANMAANYTPKYDSAQGYACALTAIIECDKTADSLRAEIASLKARAKVKE